MSERGTPSSREEGGVAEKTGGPILSFDTNLLTESAQVLKAATLSGAEIDAALEKRLKTIETLRESYTKREERLHHVENFNPLAGLTASDYDRLVKENVIDTASGDYLKNLDATIKQFEEVKDPIPDILSQLERLGENRRAMQKEVARLIAEKQQEVDTRRESARGHVVAHYETRITRLEGTIAEIEKNPLVRDRLDKDEKARREAERVRQEEEERERKKAQEAVDKEVPRTLQSVGDKHKNAFHRMGELVGDAEIGEKLRAAVTALHEAQDAVGKAESSTEKKRLAQEVREADRELYNVIHGVKKRLLDAIVEGDGDKQLKQPSEIVPWEVRSSNAYFPAMNFLQSKEVTARMSGLLAEGKPVPWAEPYLRIRDENEALKRLIGGKFLKDRGGKKTGELTELYAAFEIRKKNDEAGVTAARKAEREAVAKGKVEFNKNAAEIVGRGGFMVMGGQGVVRLEKVKGQKGTELWEVAEVYGKTGDLKVKSRSVLSMRGFPNWVGEAARTCFITQGQNFVERLQYGPEDQKEGKK